MISRIVFVTNFISDRRAVTAIEYALIAAFIAIAIVGGLNRIGASLPYAFNVVSSEL